MAEIENPARPQISENEAAMQLMFLNQPQDLDWRQGQRPSGFFNSVGRSFVNQGATVLDHWKGLGDDSENASPSQFQEIIGDRDVAMPDGGTTVNMAQRLAARYDREQEEAVYESNVRSVVGGLVGGIAPWLASPEGLVGFAVPPVRFASLSRGAAGAIRGTDSTYSALSYGAARELPTAALMGGTNALAQQAAYGEVDALESALVVGAPLALGAGAGVLRRNKIRKVQAKRRAEKEAPGTTTPPRPAQQPMVDTKVPTRLAATFQKWAGISAGDSMESAFEKLRTRMKEERVPDDVLEPLVEAYARTGMKKADENFDPEVREALRRVLDADNEPVSRAAPEDIARRADVERRMQQAEQKLTKAQRKLAKESQTIKVIKDTGKPTERRPQAQEAQRRKALRDVKKQEQNIARLRDEMQQLPRQTEAEDAVPKQQHDVNVRAALDNLATQLARKSDHPFPAEFVAEFIESAQFSGRVSPDSVRPPKLMAEDGFVVTSKSTSQRVIEDEIAADPAFAALVRSANKETREKAFEIDSRVNDIMENCEV